MKSYTHNATGLTIIRTEFNNLFLAWVDPNFGYKVFQIPEFLIDNRYIEETIPKYAQFKREKEILASNTKLIVANPELIRKRQDKPEFATGKK